MIKIEDWKEGCEDVNTIEDGRGEKAIHQYADFDEDPLCDENGGDF